MQQHRSVRDAGTSMASRAGGSPWTAALRLLAILLLALGATGPAWAACAPVETASIPSGGSATFGCSLFGFEEPPVTAPTHGTLTFGTPSNIAAVTYTNNGDGALTDTFVLRDFDTDLNITFNITVGPASSIVIAPSSLPAPSVGVAYSQTLTTTGGTAPYSYSIGAGSLPPGVTLSSSGVISGTSTGSGPYTLTVDVVDSASPLPASASKTYTFTIAAPILDLTPDTPPNGVISVPYSMQFATSGGTAPYTYTIEAGLGTLPPGLSMSSSGLVSGTPTATGSYEFSLRHDDSTTISTGGDHFRAQLVTITIDPPPTISVGPASLPTATVGAAYSQTITASGGTSPYTFAVTAGALPAGLTLGSGGTLSGTPTAGGTFNFTVTATDDNGFTGSRAYSLTVGAPTISIAPTTLPGGAAGVAYSQSITAAGAIAPYSFAVTAGALPTGLSLAANGTLSGTPTAAGTFNFTVTATDSSTGTGPFTGSRAYAVTIASPTITVAPATLPNGTIGSAYSQTITASGGTAAYGFAVTAGALPAGLTLSSTGALSGTPTAGGSFNFTVTATDANGFTGSRAYTLVIAAPVLSLSPASLPNGTIGAAYSQTITASRGTAPYSFAITAGALPAGLTLGSGGALGGTPTAQGSFSFSVAATDSSGGTGPYTGTVAYTLVIGEQAPVANAVAATVAYGSGANPITLNITGGTPTSVAVVASPSNGTAIASGVGITYQPNVGFAGADSFTYNATNGAGTSAPATVSITVSAPTITLSPTTLPDGMAGDPYGATVTGNGGAAPYTFSIVSGALPIGMSFSSAGVLSGTPSVAGTFTFTLRAADANGFTGDQAYTIVIASPTIALSPATLPNGTAGFSYSATVTGSGGVAPYSFSILSGPLPVGVSFSSAGAFSGTPSVAGTYAFTLRATDLNGFSGDHAYTVVIAAPTITMSPATLPDGLVGASYSQAFAGAGGVAPYSFSIVSGALPTGMSFSSAGVFSGTPTAGGTYNFTLRATDDNGFSGDQAYTFVVATPTITLSPATLPNGTAGTTYDQTLTAAGGTAPYGFAVTAGTLPVGMVLSGGGNLSGTVSTAGSYSFDVTATDSLGFSGVRSYTLVIGAAAPVAVDDSAATDAGVAVTIPVTANDIGTISSVAVLSSPTSGSAMVSGLDIVYTPNSGFFGADSFTYTATGPGGSSNVATVSIEVRALAVPVGVPQAVTTLAGQPVAIDAAAGASGGPFTGVTIVVPPASGAVVVSGTTITYTPLGTDSGVFTVGYTLHNAFGASAPIDSTITVNPLPLVASHEVSTVVGVPVQVELTDGATGGPFTAANVVAVSPAAAGTATIAQSGSGADALYRLTFTPAPGFAGVAGISFTLSNAFATSEPGTITIDVAPRSDPSQDPEVRGLLAAQASATRRFATAQIGNFHQRLEGMHDGGGGESGFQNGVTFAINDRCNDGARRSVGSGCQRSFADEEAPVATAVAPVGGEAGTAGHSLVLWTGGAISSGDQDDRGGGDGFDFETTGVTVGADYRLNPKFALGAGLGYGHDDTDIGDNGTRSDTEGYTVALYASYHPGKAFYLDGLLGYQWLSFDSRRHVTATGSRVSGERDGTQWFASLAAGYDYRNERIGVTPYARLDVARAQLDAYTEQGDAIHALHYGDQDVDTTIGNLGMRFEYRQPVGWGTLVPQLRLEYQHDFEGDSLATINYADLISGPFYRVRIDGADRSRFVFGLGAVLQSERDWMLRLEYRGVFGDGQGSEQSILLNFEKTY